MTAARVVMYQEIISDNTSIKICRESIHIPQPSGIEYSERM